MIKVAIIVPSLANRGPVKVVKNLIDASLLIENHNQVEYSLFYFDQVKELDFECRIHHISEIIPEEYDIIHTNGIRPDFWAYKNRARIKKHVITVHNFVFEDLKYSYNSVYSILFGYIWIQLWKKADKIISLTNTMKRYYEKFIKIEKITYAFNGVQKLSPSIVDVDDLNRITEFQKSYDYIVGSICVLTKRKGLDIVIDYLVEDSKLGFLIIGEGKAKDNLIKRATKLGVVNQCLFLGFRNNADAYYKYFNYFAMPSRSEGFGLSLIEAGLNKIPIICSDIPTFREMFDETQVSFFKLNSKESFKLAMIKSQKNRSKLTDELYQKCMRDYSLDSMFKQYHNIYKDELQS